MFDFEANIDSVTMGLTYGTTDDGVDVAVGTDVYVLSHFLGLPADLYPMTLSACNAGFVIVRAAVDFIDEDGQLHIHGFTENPAFFSTCAAARDMHLSRMQARVDEAKAMLEKAEIELRAAGDIRLLDRS